MFPTISCNISHPTKLDMLKFESSFGFYCPFQDQSVTEFFRINSVVACPSPNPDIFCNEILTVSNEEEVTYDEEIEISDLVNDLLSSGIELGKSVCIEVSRTVAAQGKLELEPEDFEIFHEETVITAPSNSQNLFANEMRKDASSGDSQPFEIVMIDSSVGTLQPKMVDSSIGTSQPRFKDEGTMTSQEIVVIKKLPSESINKLSLYKNESTSPKRRKILGEIIPKYANTNINRQTEDDGTLVDDVMMDIDKERDASVPKNSYYTYAQLVQHDHTYPETVRIHPVPTLRVGLSRKQRTPRLLLKYRQVPETVSSQEDKENSHATIKELNTDSGINEKYY